MNEVNINYLAVLIAALAHYALGAIWYSPILFGKSWVVALGKSGEELRQRGGGVKAYLGTFIATLVMTYVLAHFSFYAGANTFALGAFSGFWAWLGFVLTVKVTYALFQGSSFKLISIDSGYFLVGLLIMGGILGAWR